jgi:hypothetical protein
MSIDLKKLKKILDANHITPLEYFCFEHDCAVIKCFFNKNGEFLSIYIPSKYRFSMKNESGKIYQLEEINETTENDDYTKSEHAPDMPSIDSKSSNSYKEFSKKYEKTVSLEGNDEPVPRKIKRQVERVKLPFSRVSYDIAIQYNKCLALAFEELCLFSIKGYPTNTRRCFMFLVILTDLIDNIEKMTDHFSVMGQQFYRIIHNVSLSNLETVRVDIDQYDKIASSVSNKHEQYIQSINQYTQLYQHTIEKESKVVAEFREKINKENGLQRSTLEMSLQKQYDSFFATRNEIVDKGVELTYRFQRNLLILEEVSFDNVVMLTRVRKNFDLFKEIL